MIDPPIESLLDKVDSKFTLVTLASKRARQINSYFNQLGEGLGAIVPPQVASVARKPLSIALEEIAAGKVRSGDPVADGAGEQDEPAVVEGAVLDVVGGGSELDATDADAAEPAPSDPEQ
jgi:DNA-directed RNA polymerase subunit omega